MAACRDISFAEAAPATLHLLQGCKVKFDGEALVSEYFKPEPTDAEFEGAPVLEAGFRGRFMKGSEVALPDGFGGAVLERRPPACDGGEPGAGAATWAATATFSSFHCWNHDTAPAPTDGVRRAVEWAALAAHVHAPVDPEEVEAAATGAAAAGGEPTQS